MSKLKTKNSPIKVKQNEIVGTKQMLDPETGELVDYTVIKKLVGKDFNFHKVWLQDLLNILETMGNKKIQILSHLLSIMRTSDNSINFTMRSLAKDVSCSVQTCQTTINQLIDSNIIKRDKRIRSLYLFNPDIVAKGTSSKRQNMLIEYINEDNTPIDVELIGESKKIGNELKNKGK